jgi:hypothetical protein
LNILNRKIFTLIFKQTISRINIYNLIFYLSLLFLVKFCILPFIFTFFSMGVCYCPIRIAYAESDTDSDSESENLPKVDKGKGRATEDQVQQQEENSSREKVKKCDSDLDDRILLQEEQDRAFAISLQQEEDRAFARYLQENSGENRDESPLSDSYSVYSSEIHSDDSEHTKNRKLEVKEVEKNLKRKNPSDDDLHFESSNRKKFNKN